MRIPLGPPIDGGEPVVSPEGPSDPEKGSFVRIVLAVDGWNGLVELPVWAELDGLQVAHGTSFEGFQKTVRLSRGNHLVRVWMENVVRSMQYRGNPGLMRGRPFLFTVPGPGPYQLTLRARHAGGDAKRKPPTFRCMSQAQIDALFDGQD
jgi:hypothetical protein